MHTEPVERFQPTSGLVSGYLGLAFAAVVVGYVAVAVHTLTGVRIALGALVLAVLIWVTQLRPRATLYPDMLVLKNSLRDTAIPLALVEDVTAGQTLNVWVDDRRYVCIGIGRSARHAVRGARRPSGSLLGLGAQGAQSSPAQRTEMAYETFVVNRILELVDQAKRTAGRPDDEPRVTHVPARPEIIALVVTGIAFVASLLA